MKKITLYLLVAFIAILLIPTKAYAGFGISPSSIDNENLKPGTQIIQEFVLSRADPFEDLEATIQLEDGEMDSWLTFDPGFKVLLPAGEQEVSFQAIITIPVDAALKAYEGYFNVVASSPDPAQGVAVVSGVRVDMRLATTDAAVFDFTIRTAAIPDTYEDEDLVMIMTIQNDGNAVTAPTKVELEVQDLFENNITDLISTTITTAAAYETSDITATFVDHGLPVGEYYGLIKIFDNTELLYEDRVVFEVIPAKVYEEVCTGASQEMVDNANTYFYLAIAFGVVLAALIVFMIMKKKEDPKKNMKLIVTVVGLLIYLAVAYMAFKADTFGWFTRTCTDQLVSAHEVEVTEVAIVEDVQGVAVKTDAEPVDSLRVGIATEDGKYRVYADEDLSSEVIYLAEEGEEINVLEEKASWYRIELPEGGDGWLPKSNVKVTE